MLLVGLVAFWGKLATGAAACFSNLAPPPAAKAPSHTTPRDDAPRRKIRVKRVKSSEITGQKPAP